MVEVRRQGCSHLGEGDGAARIAQTLPAHLRVGEGEGEISRDALFAHTGLGILVLTGERCPDLMAHELRY